MHSLPCRTTTSWRGLCFLRGREMSGPPRRRAQQWEANVQEESWPRSLPSPLPFLVVIAAKSHTGKGPGGSCGVGCLSQGLPGCGPPSAGLRWFSEQLWPSKPMFLGAWAVLCSVASLPGRERLGARYPREEFVPTAEQPGRPRCGGQGLVSFPAPLPSPRWDSQLLQQIQHRPDVCWSCPRGQLRFLPDSQP